MKLKRKANSKQLTMGAIITSALLFSFNSNINAISKVDESKSALIVECNDKQYISSSNVEFKQVKHHNTKTKDKQSVSLTRGYSRNSSAKQTLIDKIEKEELEKAKLAEEAEKVKIVQETKLSNSEIAKLTIEGKYGNGDERKVKLEKEGYIYSEIQKEIAEMNPQPKEIVESVQQAKNTKVIKAFPHNNFKSYMRWTALAKNSPQGKLCAKASKDPKTAIMKYKGRYLVALGFAYTDKIGEDIDVVMDSGEVIPVTVGDWKAKGDTDANNSSSTNNGSIIEFIVSSNADANNAVKGSGSYDTIFKGGIKEFRK